MASSVIDSRAITSNNSRNIQGTLIFDVPKVDSRVSGAPINSNIGLPPADSRIGPNIPQNSRV